MTAPVNVPQSPQFSYHFSWDRAVFRRANRQVLRYAKYPAWLRVGLKLAPWTGGLVLTIWLATILIVHDWGALARSSPWIFLIVAWIAFLLYGTGWLGARAWEKRHPPGHREIVIGVDRTGFNTSSYPGDLRLKWDALVQIIETDAFFLFYATPQMAYYLPKAVVPPSDASALRLFLADTKGTSYRVVG
jgi:YcxB-like protein